MVDWDLGEVWKRELKLKEIAQKLQTLLKKHLHAIEGVGARDDVGAVPAHQEADTLVEGLQGAQSGRDLGFLDNIQWIRRAHTQRCGVT